MKSPQKENGYTPIANELLEQFMSSDFSKRQLIVILSVCRMTYGYNRKSDAVSGWQIAQMTKLDRSHVSKTIKELVEMNVITKAETGRESHGVLVAELSINKHYNEWITVAETATVAKTAPLPIHGITVAETATKPLPKQPTLESNKTTKTSIAKKSIKTSIPKDFSISEEVEVWANKNGFKNLNQHLDNFILSCESKNYQYVNWDSGFKRAIKDNWAKVTSSSRGLSL